HREQAVPPNGSVLRRHRLERAAGQVTREDDVHDVLRGEAPHRRDRIDDCDGPFDRDVVVDTDFLRELAVERVDEALAAVDAAARKQPVPPARLLVPAEQHAPAPPKNCRHANPRLHQTAEDPKPRTPRSLSGSSSTSSNSNSGIGTTTSCAIRIPRSTTNDSLVSVFRRITRSSPR